MASAAVVESASRPLVGREAELAALHRAWELCRERRETRVVTLLGANGIGKSRIIHAHLARLRTAGGRAPRAYRGSARDLRLSYGVFTRLLRSRFGLVEGMDAEAAKGQVRAQVSKVLDDRKVGDVCYFLGQLLDLPFTDSPLTKAVADDPLQARLLRRAIMRSFIESDAAQGPLCLMFEELHNADDESIELLRHLFESLKGPILVLCTARPELLTRHQDWFDFGGARHTRLDVGPVTDADAVRIMETLLAPCEGGPPDALVEAGVNLAGGTPGLLEQMVRIFHDHGVLVEETALAREPVWKVNLDRLAAVRLPITVDDAVSARIAALGPEDKRLLECAAAMGSVFWLSALVSLARLDADAPRLWRPDASEDATMVRERIESLVQRDYVLAVPDSSFESDEEFVFKHNLERERIAQLTNPAALRKYHQGIADWLEQKASARSHEEHVAMLAHHLELAGARTRAGQIYVEAGDVARAHYAARKAHEHYARGLDLLGESNARLRLEALHNDGDVLVTLGRTDDALTAFWDMQNLAYRLGLASKGAAAHNRIGRLHRDLGALAEASEHLEAALALFTACGDERGIASCHDDIGKLLWIKGEYEPALERMKDALERRKQLGDRRSIALSFNNIGLVWMDHGREANAREAFQAALELRREIDDPLGVVQSLNNLGRLAQTQNDHVKALELFREAHDIARDMGERNRIAVVLTNIGEAHYRLGDLEQAVRILGEAEELCDELGDRLHLAEAKRGLAKAYLLKGELRRAREHIKVAVDLFGQVKSKVHLAVALRTLGEVTGAGAWGEGHEGKAVDYFMRAIAMCKEVGNELEVAKSYRAFADYVTRSPHYRANADIQREAAVLSEMADEIFARRRIQPSG